MNLPEGRVYVGHVFHRDPKERAHADCCQCVVAKDRAALVRETCSIDPEGLLLWLYWIVSSDGSAMPVVLCDAYGVPVFILSDNFIDLIEPHFTEVVRSAAISARFSIL